MFDDGTWAVADGEGRYDAGDPKRSAGLHWVVGGIVELQQLKERFYRPGLLPLLWTGSRLPAVDGKIGEVSAPPRITAVESSKTDPSRVRIELSDNGCGFGKVVVKVNDRELPPLRVADARNGTAVVPLQLSGAAVHDTGENTIEVVAYDERDIVASRPRGLTVPAASPPSKVLPTMFALIVGTSTFSGAESMNLRFAAKDARDFATALRVGTSRMLGAERVRVTLLASDAATEAEYSAGGVLVAGRPTKSNIRRALAEIGKDAGAHDIVLVYLAGHGQARSDRYYYLTQDARTTDLSDAGLREETTFGSDELATWLIEAVKADKRVIIIDTCAAGAAAGDINRVEYRRNELSDQARASELLHERTGSFI